MISHQLPEVTTYDSSENTLMEKTIRNIFAAQVRVAKSRDTIFLITGLPKESSPRKTIKYIQVKPRLLKLFNESNLAKLVQAGEINLNKDDGMFCFCSQEAKEWKRIKRREKILGIW